MPPSSTAAAWIPASPPRSSRGTSSASAWSSSASRASSALDLAAPLRTVGGVGPARARDLANAGLHTVRDLILHLPFRYEDRRGVLPVAAAVAGGSATLRGGLAGARPTRT